MFGLNDILLGGLLPLAVAAMTFAISWAASRRPAVAWSLAVIIGYAAGAVALDARGAGLASALKDLAIPAEAKHWTPLLALLAVIPSMASAALRNRRWPQLLLAALLCAATPAWLLWGSSYLPRPEVRASGFAKNAWSVTGATIVLSLLSVALLVAWQAWRQAAETGAAKWHSVLAVAALVAAAAIAGLTGSFVYAQLFAVLAATVGGTALAAMLLRAPSGPDAAAGPITVLANCLLLLAACYSALYPSLAVGVYVAILFTAGWLPGLARLRPPAQIAIRTLLVAAPLSVVLWQAAAAFLETQRQQQEAADSNPYLNL
jgi:hypothetical protein